MNPSAVARPGSQAGRREWLGLIILALPALLLNLDLSVLYLALPDLVADLRPSATQQLWILDIYGFMVAGFLITMGTLGDRIGRRKLLLVGTAAFGAASVFAAYSSSPEMLIAARTALGIAGATVAPCALALVRTMFEDPKQRGIAVGIWMGCFMGGAVIGPIVGGVMLSSFWWGSVFLLAVPVMLLVLVVGPTLLPEARNPNAGRLDLPSTVLYLAAVLLFIWGIKEGATSGWEFLPILAVVAGIAIGAVFFTRQRRLRDPLLDLSLFANPTFRGAFVLSLLGGALLGGTLLLVNLYLQMVNGYSPLRAGLWLVPTAVAMLFTIMLSPALAQKFRPAYVMAAGMLLSTVGFLLLTQLESTGGLALLVVGWGLAIGGLGPATSLGYDMILGSAPPEKSGSASATVETGGQVGAAMGIAIMGSISAAVYRSDVQLPAGLPAQAAEAARDSITGAVSVAAQLPGAVATQLLGSAREAFTGGMQTVAVIGAVVFAVMAVYAARALRHVPPSSSPAGRPAEAVGGPTVDADGTDQSAAASRR